MPTISDRMLRRIKRHDRVARWVITLGGTAIIASVVLILALVAGNAIPLFLPGRAREVARVALVQPTSHDVLAVGIDALEGMHALAGYVVARDGRIRVLDLATGEILAEQQISPPQGSRARTLCAVERHAGEFVQRQGGLVVDRRATSRYTLLWDDGSITLVDLVPTPEHHSAGKPVAKHAIVTRANLAAEGQGPVLRAVARHAEVTRGLAIDEPVTAVRLLPGNRLVVTRAVAAKNLLGETVLKLYRATIEEEGLGAITALTMDRQGTCLYAGTDQGQIACWQLDDSASVVSKEIVAAFDDGRAVTALAMVFGDVSLAVGDSQGGLTTWFPVRVQGGRPVLTRTHALRVHDGPVEAILPSARNKSLLSLGSEGAAHLDHVTSERHLLALGAEDEPLARVGFAPRGGAAIGLDRRGELIAWEIDVPHPEVSWKTLFGRVHYEGYDAPSMTWQTTGADDYEAKISVVPLVFGTFKGTVYAMLFAVPLALFGAVYTSHFTTPGFKRAIKPAIEIMAALPSVVIGFLVALWLAPIVDRWVLAVAASALTIPLAFVAFLALWQRLRRFDWARRIETGYEFLVLIPVIAAGAALATLLVTPMEHYLFDGDFKLWMYQTLGMRYDMRNAIIIAFGLGFAVIPIIFSIAEDSLSTVPPSLSAASMALGASRWQTVWRVVLPSASPGIFAGVMIGFGRAVGETMIVLMATGNTPILDWSPLNGMRTLSANIAVEIPEAPVDGTLYRVLFLCAVLLFLMTFALNTAAELVRQRLRKRYGRF